MQAEQKNWALRESGASIAAVSHEATHAASGAENLLADKDSTLWIAGDPPQFVTLELASLHPPICYAGWSVSHDYSTNPKLVEVSSGITRDTLSSVMLCKGLPGTGSQLWKLPQPIPSTHRFVCFSILKTFDEGPTYMNTVILLSSPPGLQYSHFREPKLGTLDKTISRNSSPPPTNTMPHYPIHQGSMSSNPVNGSMDRTMASSFSSLSGTGCPPLMASDGVAGFPSGDSPPWATRTTGGSADSTKVVECDTRVMVPPLVFPRSSASEERAAQSHSEGGAAEESFPTSAALPSSALLFNAPQAVDAADPARASPREKELWNGSPERMPLAQKSARKVGEERVLSSTPVASTDFSSPASPSSPPRSIKSQLTYLINDVSRLRQLQGISPRVDPIIPFLPAPLPLEKEMPYTLAKPTTSNLAREEDEENEEEGEEYEEEEEEEEERKEKGKAHKVEEEEEEDDPMEPSDGKKKKRERYSRHHHRHQHSSHPSRHPSSDSFSKKDRKSGREKMRRSHLQRHASTHSRKHPKEDDSASHTSSSSTGSRFSASLHSSSSPSSSWDASVTRHHTRGSRHSPPTRRSRHGHHDAPQHHRHSSSSHHKKKKNSDSSSGHRYYYYDPRDRNGHHIPYSVPPSASRDSFFRASAGVPGREVPMGWQEEDRVLPMQWGRCSPSLTPPFPLVSLPDGRQGSAMPGASSASLSPPERTTAAADGATPCLSPSAVQAREAPSQAPSTAPLASPSPSQSMLARQREENARLAAVESSLAAIQECVRMQHEDTTMLKRWALQAQLTHGATRHPDRATPREGPREADEDVAKGKKNMTAVGSKGEERHRGASPSHDVALKMITTVMEAHVQREAQLVGRVDHLEGTVSALSAQLQACQSQLAALQHTCAQRYERAKKNTTQLHQQCNERWNVWEAKHVTAPHASSQADPPIRHGKEREEACATVVRHTEHLERRAEERRPDGGRRRQISDERRRTPPSSPSSLAWGNGVSEAMMRAYVMQLVEASASRQQHTWEKQMLHSLDHYLMDVTNHVIKVVRKHVRVMVKEELQHQQDGRVGGGESTAKGGPFPSLPPTASSAPSPPSPVVLVLQQEGKRAHAKPQSLQEMDRKEVHTKRRLVEKRRAKKHPVRPTREKDSCSESSPLHEDSHEKETKRAGRSSTRDGSEGAPWATQEMEGAQKRSAYAIPPPPSLPYNGSPATFSSPTQRQSPLPPDGHPFANPPHPAYPTAPSSASYLHGMPPIHPFYFSPPYWPAPGLESTAPRGTPPVFAGAEGTDVNAWSSPPQSGGTHPDAFSAPAPSNTGPSPKRGEGEGLPFPTPLTPPSSTSGVSVENLLRFYYLHHPPPDSSAPHRVNGYPAEEAPLATIGEETSTESE